MAVPRPSTASDRPMSRSVQPNFAIVTQAQVEGRVSWPIWYMNSTERISIAPGMRRMARSAPQALARRAENARRSADGRVSRSTASAIRKLSAVNTAAAKNGTRGPYWPSKPPITGPITKPMPQAAPLRPKYLARFSGGMMSATTALAVAKVAPAMPAMRRPTKSQARVGARPIST